MGWRDEVPRPNANEQCSVCGGFFMLCKDGTIRYHAASNRAGGCKGSRRPPGHHVHRCSCGCTWDEEVYA